MCGAALVAPSSEAPSTQPQRTCPSCGKATASAFSFCQHCGHALADAGVQALAAAAAALLADSGVRHLALTPEPAPLPSVSAMAELSAVISDAPRRLARERAGDDFAPGPTVVDWGSPVDSARAGAVTTIEPLASGLAAPASSVVVSLDAPTHAPDARLVAVRRDGTDGAVYDVRHDGTEIGRTDTAIAFPEDLYVGALHARVERADGRWWLVPVDRRNGVYVRLREPCELQTGDQFVCGRQVFRFEIIEQAEVEPPASVEHGVRFFGTPTRSAWGRLRQITVAGTSRDVFHLTRSENVIGREEGEVRYPDDEFLSRRHAAVSLRGGKPRLYDLGSSNGTYVRLRGRRDLRSGDLVRLGDQLLRFEL
jgi:pSer/pThr/pTyr-binding forkhead associated (FHA) protein